MENNGKLVLGKLGRSFKGAFQKNWVLMLVSLLFGLLIWGYVVADQNPVRSKRVTGVIISLEGTNDLLSRNLIVVDADMGKATVTVNAELTRHSEIDATRINCGASVNKITAQGIYTLPLDVSVQSGLGTVANVSPESVQVEVDQLSTKTVPVQLNYEGELPEGYSFSNEYYERTLTLEGAARYIEPVYRAIATVDLTDFTHNLEGAVNVVCYDRDGNELTVITRTHQEPSIIVRLSVTAHRELPVILDLTPPDTDYYETAYSLSHATVVVWGEKNVLDKLTAVYTEHVELTPEMWDTAFECALIVPDGTVLRTGAPSRIRATVTVTEKIYEQTFSVSIKPENLARGLSIADYKAVVEVKVSGTKSRMDALVAADITAVVDLTGRGAGEHSLPIEVSIHKKGYETLTIAVEPESITLLLK